MKKILFALTASLIVTGCASHSKNFTPGELPPAVEVTESKTSESFQLLQQYASSENIELTQKGPLFDRIQKILHRLEKAAGLKESHYPLYVGDAGPQKNAFAFNTNTIVVYKALADAVPKDEELAVILAHEVSHILARHTEDDTQQSRGTAVVIGSQILGAAVGAVTGVSGLGDIATQGSQALGAGAFVLSYGRGQEYEADHYGLLLMAKAGYDPENAISVWANADTILGQGSSNDFLSSHPSHGNRLERLKEDMPLALEYYKQSKL